MEFITVLSLCISWRIQALYSFFPSSDKAEKWSINDLHTLDACDVSTSNSETVIVYLTARVVLTYLFLD